MSGDSDWYKLTLLCVDDKKNRILFRRDRSNSVFEYQIETEVWTYVCKWESWPDFAPHYGMQVKRKKKNG